MISLINNPEGHPWIVHGALISLSHEPDTYVIRRFNPERNSLEYYSNRIHVWDGIACATTMLEDEYLTRIKNMIFTEDHPIEFTNWYEAAVTERVRRVRAENALIAITELELSKNETVLAPDMAKKCLTANHLAYERAKDETTS